jgi:SAM-dependent methyltransferase
MSLAGGYDDDYGFIADLYDHVVPYRARPDVAFFVELAKQAGGRVLELGCGTGRVLVPIAQAGVEITGFDVSARMLAMCAQRLNQQPAAVRDRVRLEPGDMRRFDLGETFALITIPFRPFQHLLTVDDQLSCLANVRAHLADEGRFVLDLFNPSLDMLANPRLGEESGEEPDFVTPDGRTVRRRQKTVACDRFEQVNQYELIYYVTHPGGRTERLVHAFPLRYLFKFEAEHLLARAGFAIEAVYADYEKRPFGTAYPGELIFVARKAG